MSLTEFELYQVPADGVFISGHSLSIDESSMTGESKLVSFMHLLPTRCTISPSTFCLKLNFSLLFFL